MERPLDTLGAPTRKALVALARSALGGPSSCAPAPGDLDVAHLAPALDAALVEPCEGGFAFLDPDTHAQAVALAFVPDARASWDDSAGLVTIIHRVWSLQHRGKKGHTHSAVHPVARLLLSLRDEGCDVSARVPDLIAADYPAPGEYPDEEPGKNWQQRKTAIKLAVRDALSLLDPTPSEVLAAGIAAGMYFEDSNGVGHNYLGLGALGRDHPETARRVFDLVEADPTPAGVALVPHLLYGLAATDPDDALGRTLALTEHGDPGLVRAGAYALGSLYFPPGDDRYDAVFDRLDTLSAEPDPNLDRAVAQALAGFPIRTDAERALSLLVRLAPRPSAASAVARAVADLSVHEGPEVYRAALLRLAESTALDGDGVDALRSALYEAPPNLVLDVAGIWAGSREPGSPSLPDALGYALDNVPDEDLDARIVQWFASGDSALARAAAEVVNDSRRMNRAWAFPTSALAGLDARELLHVARQVLGRVHHGRALAGLCLSFFDRPDLPPEVAKFVTERLVDFVAFTRPAETEDVLSTVDVAERPAAAVVVAGVLSRVKTQNEAYQALPRRTELVSPLDRVRPFVMARRRFERAIHKRAEQKGGFILRELFAEVQVRGGKGFIFEMHDGALETTPFQHVEVGGFSLFGDVVDPVGQAFRRLVWMVTPLPAAKAPKKTPALATTSRTSRVRRRSTRIHPRRRYPKRRYPGRRRPGR